MRRRRCSPQGVEQDLHDDGQSVGEQDSPRDAAAQAAIRDFIQAVDYDAERARPVRRRRRKPASPRTSSSTWPSARAAGFRPATRRVALAKLVDTLPNLKLRGLLSYDGGAQHINGFAARKDRALNGLEANVARVRSDEGGRAEHRDLQRRRHGHLQRPAPDARLHRRAGRQLRLHGHAVPRHRQRGRRPGLQGFRAVADRADDGAQQPLSRTG